MATTLKRRKPDQAQQPVSAAERITVALTSRAAHELRRLREWSGLSKTDVVNRALSVYAFVAEQERAGRRIAVHDPEKGEFQLVHIV